MKTWSEWSPEQDQRLKDVWSTAVPMRLLEHEFAPHTRNGIYRRAKVLGLPNRHETVKASSMGWERIKEALKQGPMDPLELAAKADLSRRQVYTIMKKHHAAGEVHIARWQKFDSDYPVVLWAIGSGKDAPRPKAKTSAERSRARMAHINRFDLDEADRIRGKRRIQDAKRRGKLVRRDPLVAALYGEAA